MRDTIAAIATAPGEGGIAIIRLSGPEAERVLERVFRPARPDAWPLPPRLMTYGTCVDGDEPIDECLAVRFPAPHSYTAEDVAEIQVHGGQAVAQRALLSCLRAGARLAGPGEFTRRAFENGRIDLSRAEAIMALIAARGEQSRKAALRQLKGSAASFIGRVSAELYSCQAALAACIDYPEEISEEEAASDLGPRLERLRSALSESADPRAARLLSGGLRAAIAGRPNVGKSSLLNALIGENRAIVTAIPGTTRDLVTGELSLNGCEVRLTDTAGLRDTADPVEQEGISRARAELKDADCVIAVLDASMPLTDEDKALLEGLPDCPVFVALNKADLPAGLDEGLLTLRPGWELARVCAHQPDSLAPLRAFLERQTRFSDRLSLTQPRHVEAALRASNALKDALEALRQGALDLVSVDLQTAQSALAEITGEDVSEEVIDRVFAEFCVGK
ncbi:MAG: tRNA uridine-5-carboxymethylaminomethyl(34) synthesis GTPase MnmE [Clostridia bacterium]|nr:tRNA uridine-5-carboxymethylaminomethyl(34) synthesis GTPase MnmE [Clostridia bacterium]